VNSQENHSKVSVVIPCYNKEKFISATLESILAQEWDNIELILINDGSTDGTRKIISEYQPRLMKRKYDVIIIDQENKGVSAAVFAGLLRITGKYVCQIDADDRLDPQYISLMAQWLEENPDYDWTACDAIGEREGMIKYRSSFPDGEQQVYSLENWLLWRIQRGVWMYLIRTEYLKHCNVMEFFYTGRDGNQEPQIIFPLIVGGGKIKYINKPLYIYIYDTPNTHRSYICNYEDSNKRWTGFIKAVREVINSLSITNEEKDRLCALSDLNHTMLIAKCSLYLGTSKEINEICVRLITILNKSYVSHNIINESYAYSFPKYFINAIDDCVEDTVHIKDIERTGRIIAWGALGKSASKLLPHLIGTSLEPDELWDVKCNGNDILEPDISKLTKNDLVLVLPQHADVVSEINAMLSSTNCLIMRYEQIRIFISAKLFPEFYDGTVKFTSVKTANH